MTWDFVAKYAEELDVVVDPSWIAPTANRRQVSTSGP